MRRKRVQLVGFSIFLLSFLGGNIATDLLSSDVRMVSNLADNSTETEDAQEDETEVEFSYVSAAQTLPREQIFVPIIMNHRTGFKHPLIEIYSPPPE